MARSILEILLRTKGGKKTEGDITGVGKAASGMGAAFKSAGAAIAGLGLAAGLVNFGKEAFFAAAQGRAMKSALESTLGPAENYADAIARAKEVTRGMVDEATLAGTITAQMAAGIANTAEEAADLTQAGSILSTVFAASGASMESFNRLLSTGSAQLIDNFNLTLGQVNARKALIEADGKYTGQQAKLQAIKELLIESSKQYEGSISAEQEAIGKATAAWDDFQGAMGEFIAGPGAGLLNWAAESIRALEEGAKAWLDIGDQIQQVGRLREIQELQGQLETGGRAFQKRPGQGQDEIAERLLILQHGSTGAAEAMEALALEERRAASAAERYGVEVVKADARLKKLIITAQAGRSAGFADMFKEAGEAADIAFGKLKGERQAGLFDEQGFGGVTQAEIQASIDKTTELEDAQVQAARTAADAWESEFSSKQAVLSSVLAEGFGVLDDLNLPFLSQDTGRDIAENARRLAAVAAGDFSGEAARLLEQEKPELFRKVMASGDPAAMAQDILKEFQSGVDTHGLVDEATALERARQIIFGNISKEEMAARLTEQLMGEGFGQEQISSALGQAGFSAGGNEQAIEGGATGFGDFEAGLLLAAEEGETMSKLGVILGAQVKDNPDWLEAGLAAGRAFEAAFFQTFEAGGWGGRMISKIVTDVVAQIGLPHPMEGRGTP